MNSRQPICRYGKDCYRKNPQHLSDFAHPHKEKKIEQHKQELEGQQQMDIDEKPGWYCILIISISVYTMLCACRYLSIPVDTCRVTFHTGPP